MNDKIAVNFATDVPISVFYIKVKRRDVYPFFERAVYDKIAIFGTQLRQLYSLMAWRLTAALVADIKIV
ncbi:MAG: hypothetical protein LBP40_01300, partial [Campylobacteraceae bacterium]|nr:hypothetical protein [Campylobacteraceae bacterium]